MAHKPKPFQRPSVSIGETKRKWCDLPAKYTSDGDIVLDHGLVTGVRYGASREDQADIIAGKVEDPMSLKLVQVSFLSGESVRFGLDESIRVFARRWESGVCV